MGVPPSTGQMVCPEVPQSRHQEQPPAPTRAGHQATLPAQGPGFLPEDSKQRHLTRGAAPPCQARGLCAASPRQPGGASPENELGAPSWLSAVL